MWFIAPDERRRDRTITLVAGIEFGP
jgi:hypothetical protein